MIYTSVCRNITLTSLASTAIFAAFLHHMNYKDPATFKSHAILTFLPPDVAKDTIKTNNNESFKIGTFCTQYVHLYSITIFITRITCCFILVEI